MSDSDGPDLSCFDFGEEEEEEVSPPPATPPPPATKGPSRAAKRAAKKQQEEAAREARIEQEKAAPASSPPPRAPGTPASLGEFARWAARQSELAGRSDEPLAALAALAAPSSRGGGWDERGRLQALLLRWEAAEAGPSPQLSPRHRQLRRRCASVKSVSSHV